MNSGHFLKFLQKYLLVKALQVWIEHPPVVTYPNTHPHTQLLQHHDARAGDFPHRNISTVNRSLERRGKPVWN